MSDDEHHLWTFLHQELLSHMHIQIEYVEPIHALIVNNAHRARRKSFVPPVETYMINKIMHKPIIPSRGRLDASSYSRCGFRITSPNPHLIRNHHRDISIGSASSTLFHEIRKHLYKHSSTLFVMMRGISAHLDSIEWPTRAFWVELYAPDTFTRFRRRDDTLHRRIITINEEWRPTRGELLGETKSVLMVLRLNPNKKKKKAGVSVFDRRKGSRWLTVT